MTSSLPPISWSSQLTMTAKGWHTETLDDHFKLQRQRADDPDEKTAATWFHMMKNVMKEVDLASGCIPAFNTMKFLDIG